jgi:predicted nuclease of predicted toxin-antitoxin system
LDENLSPQVAREIQDLFPGSTHLTECGLGSASDTDIWNYAKRNGFCIVSKDSDFYNRSILSAEPPKIVWIRAGNCSSAEIKDLLRGASPAIAALDRSDQSTLVILLRPK